jgi:hypothetical protein
MELPHHRPLHFRIRLSNDVDYRVVELLYPFHVPELAPGHEDATQRVFAHFGASGEGDRVSHFSLRIQRVCAHPLAIREQFLVSLRDLARTLYGKCRHFAGRPGDFHAGQRCVVRGSVSGLLIRVQIPARERQFDLAPVSKKRGFGDFRVFFLDRFPSIGPAGEKMRPDIGFNSATYVLSYHFGGSGIDFETANPRVTTCGEIARSQPMTLFFANSAHMKNGATILR